MISISGADRAFVFLHYVVVAPIVNTIENPTKSLYIVPLTGPQPQM